MIKKTLVINNCMRVKDRIASSLGSIIEWYDFSLYGFFAPLLAQLYFPSEVQSIALIKIFSVFAIGFFARPVGALIFGYISDKYGRVVSLKLTPLLIAFPTVLFSLLPTFQQISFFAPILLIFLRIWQGICIGGEFANNIIYLCETTNRKNLYFMGSIGACAGSLGILSASIIATLCYTLLSLEQISSWGWRIAFSVAPIIGIFSFVMRRNMKETSVFINIKSNSLNHNPIIDSYKNQFHDYLLSFGLTFLPATAFYYIFMFMPNFLFETLHHTSSKILNDNSLSLLGRILIIPMIGLLADKIGGIKIARLAGALFLFLSIPLFYNILYNSSLYLISIYVFAFLTTLTAATTPGLLVSILKPETRCTVFSFTFNVCFGVLGGITPFISFLLVDKTGSKMAPVFYLAFAAIVTIISTFFFHKRNVKYES